MDQHQVNFLTENNTENNIYARQSRKNKAKPWKKIIGVLSIVFVLSLGAFYYSIAFSGTGLFGNLSKINPASQVGGFITGQDKTLKGEADDRINILIIGKGGSDHEGGNLADTIILMSYKPSTKQVAMMSIPRDMNIPENGYWHKINGVTAYAESAEPGSGGQTMLNVLNKTLDSDIPYYVSIDFDGFEKVIDEFGGVDVNVDRDLVDYSYPIRGKEMVFPISSRFEILRIKQGPQHMDGELALKYARSRHAAGAEGSDFARSARQQKVILALKEKIISADTLLNPKRINSLLAAYSQHITTNMELGEMLQFAKLAKDADTSQIISQPLSDGPGGLLYANKINGAYVLLPIKEDFSDLKNLWKYIFYKKGIDVAKESGSINFIKPKIEIATTTQATTTATSTMATSTDALATSTDNNAEADNRENQVQAETINTVPTFQDEDATIEIQNGTWTTGYANLKKTELEKLGFNIVSTGNAENHSYEKTLIYDFSKGKNPATAKELAKTLGAKVANPPSGFTSSADFLIILGTK